MAAVSSLSLSKICYNTECNESKSEPPKKGWMLSTGEFAELCDRCGSAFEEGRFCETFHLKTSGWRNCETCRKQIHCGCIVSSNSFALLDPGGVECIACARKNIILPSNFLQSQSYSFQSHLSKNLRDLGSRNWSQLAASGPAPWKQSSSLFSPDVPSLVEFSTNVGKINCDERYPASPLEKTNKDLSGISVNKRVKLGAQEMMLVNGMISEEKSSSCLNISQQLSSLKKDLSPRPMGMAVSYSCSNTRNALNGVAGSHSQQTHPPHLGKQFSGTVHIAADPFGKTQPGNEWSQVDVQGRNQLLPRNRPTWANQELQQKSLGSSNSVITWLFQKTLSVSDAGRIGRLVLPKKCAEAHFPPISQPEGLPLKILDAKGKEWVFQFRYWPNNNSRMYVLEGVTPFIQSMKLQAGDTVTFSRLEPEGRLVIGFCKASSATFDQDNETNKTVELADRCTWSKVDNSEYIAKEVLGSKSSISGKKNSSTLGLKGKRRRLGSEDVIEVKITWEEAQDLLCPPANLVPSIVVIEGFELEEYEDAPVLGKPKLLMTENVGSTFSAAQEPTAEQLENIIPPCNSAFSKKMKTAKLDPDNIETLERFDTLANLAISEEGETLRASAQATTGETLPASAQATTKHPRHRPGCSCIVCIQPPSGRGPKHDPTCTCNVCSTVRRRFHTLMLRREKKQSESEVETTCKKQQVLFNDDFLPCDSFADDLNRIKLDSSPFKGQIDLNSQPEREDELSPGVDTRAVEQHSMNSGDVNMSENQSERVEGGVGEGNS